VSIYILKSWNHSKPHITNFSQDKEKWCFPKITWTSSLKVHQHHHCSSDLQASNIINLHTFVSSAHRGSRKQSHIYSSWTWGRSPMLLSLLLPPSVSWQLPSRFLPLPLDLVVEPQLPCRLLAPWSVPLSCLSLPYYTKLSRS